MKSYWMQSDGVNADIDLREVDQPVPGPGQMLIRVRAAGLNRGEFILSHGLHKAGTAKQIGMEAAGEVISCGTGVCFDVRIRSHGDARIAQLGTGSGITADIIGGI
jgi:NADPH:quinone reductase